MTDSVGTRSGLLKQRVDEYVEALQQGDLERMLALFAPDAKVTSPLAGMTDARRFYQDLFKVSRTSKVQVLQRMSEPDEGSAAALLEYDWTLENGAHKRFECMDLFRFDEENRIRELKIFYDPGDIVSEYEAARAQPESSTE